jgi:curved DNA-binding protein
LTGAVHGAPVNGQSDTSLAAARRRLGVGREADEAALRAAFREAAKRAHPDRAGGDAAEFRAVIEAYQRLRAPKASPIQFPPAKRPPRAVRPGFEIEPAVAMSGGAVLLAASDGRTLRVTLPPGLREGDKVRAGGESFEARIRVDRDMLVRGDDIWVTARVAKRLLVEGGRVEVATPFGQRAVWVNRRAGVRRLVRIPGQGLPARGRHAQGHLFLRLEAEGEPSESVARALLRRFAAAWAA